VSGERKTATDLLACKAVYDVEAGWRSQYDDEMETFRADHEAWKAACEDAKKANKGNGRAKIRQALLAVGPEPKPPPHCMLLVDDLTPEGLVLHLRDGRPWCGIFSDEGGVFVGGPGFTAEKVMQTGTLLNRLWDGKPIRRARVLTGPAYLPGRRCSAHLMMQPIVADQLLGNATLDGVGTLSRTLVVAPETTMGTRIFQDVPDGYAQVMEEYEQRVADLLERTPNLAANTTDVLAPKPLSLTVTARKLWIPFYNEVERALRPGGEFNSIAAFGAKLAEHAGRLAAVLTVFAEPDVGDVGV
jgi:hypothetical protein